MTRFIVVPQWQGSPSTRAMLLVDGAQAIAGDLPRASCTVIDVPLEAGESLGTGVHRLSALRRIRAELDEELAVRTEHTLVVGGDCGVAVAAVARAAVREPGLAVVWLDAHPDLHTPDSSPSGAFSGMALRAVLGEGADGLALPAGLVAPERVVLAGARSFDPPEEQAAARVTVLPSAALSDPDALAAAVRATGAASVFVHVDLDVLDPSGFAGVTDPVPFGVPPADLVAALAALRGALPLAGASISGFAPPTPSAAVDDLGAVLRLVGVLV